MYQVVIVDDEPNIVDGLKSAIDWEGYHFEIACAVTNSLSALEYIQCNDVQLLITDVSMPYMDGVELLKKAKKVNPLLSVIVLSAYDNFEYVRTSLRYGAENYLLKPLDPDELAESVSQIVNHMQEREQLSNTYGRAMLTFRSNFIELWAKNSLSNDDLKTKANLLGIDLGADNYTVIIFSSPDNNSPSMSRFFDYLLSFLPGYIVGHFYFETPNRLVSIMTALNSEKTSIPLFVKNVIKSAFLIQMPIFASSGCQVHHYSEVGDSYQKAHSNLFIKYTWMPYFIYDNNKLSQSYEALINAQFDKTNLNQITVFIDSLHSEKLKSNEIKRITIEVVSRLLQQVEKNVDDIFVKFSNLVELLKLFPGDSAGVQEYKIYTKNLIRECLSIHDVIQQSMYPCVDAVIKAVNELSDKDISLKTLAQKLNVSPSYLGTIFKQQTGYYFNDYLANARLQYAAKLIEHSDMKMKDIVEKVGFSSQTYFNRSFKRYFNMSPVAYRRQKKTS